MSPNANVPDALLNLEEGFLVVVPIFSFLYVWREHAQPRGIGFRDCAYEIFRALSRNLALLAFLAAVAGVVLWYFYGAFWDGFSPLSQNLWGFAVIAVIWGGSWGYSIMAVMNAAPMGRDEDEVIRGPKIVDGSAGQEASANWRAEFERTQQQGQVCGSVPLCGIYMPREAEVRHTLALGVTGTGKSITIRGAMRGAAERARRTGEKMLICDPDGGYLSRFFSPERGDIILNPFDARSASWALFNEIREPYDYDNIATSLVPDPGGQAAEWANMARTIVSSAMKAIEAESERLGTGQPDARDLYEVCCLAKPEELRKMLAETPAARFFAEKNEKTMASILTTVNQNLQGLQYLPRGGSFSVSEWVRSGRGWLFLPYTGKQIAALRSLYRTWVRTAIFETLSLPERDNGLWFIIDEFDALGKLDGMSDAMPRLRKFGGRVILGLQTIAKVESMYGRGDSNAIVENCGNVVILKCSTGDQHGDGTSKFASHLIGERQISRTIRSFNVSSGSGQSSAGHSSQRGTSFTISQQIVPDHAVMASEIQDLRIGTGYLKFATEPEWMKVSFPEDSMPKIAEPYIAKEWR